MKKVIERNNNADDWLIDSKIERLNRLEFMQHYYAESIFNLLKDGKIYHVQYSNLLYNYKRNQKSLNKLYKFVHSGRFENPVKQFGYID